ncbi:cation channel sperm-associated protein 1-like [Gordionus sp. m RMFG-2023]|uniref:cation channel sperm-associated protein 1-like n=1 Tax=Gordionus sp. m RMFG-2023 TaxID=3053472 RepID=UPI0031FD23AC
MFYIISNLKEIKFSEAIHQIVASPLFSKIIFFTIIINTIELISDSFDTINAISDSPLAIMNNIFLAFYIFEMSAKLYVWKKEFFEDRWNTLDLIIVSSNCLEYIYSTIVRYANFIPSIYLPKAMVAMNALRIVKTLRVLRLLKYITTLRVVTSVCLGSMKSLGAIFSLMILFVYVFAVIGVSLFKNQNEHFNDLITASYTIFQILTLDNWFAEYATLSHNSSGGIFLFLVTCIIVEYFVLFNLFIAVLADNFQYTITLAKAEREKEEIERTVKEGEILESYIEDMENKFEWNRDCLLKESENEVKKIEETNGANDDLDHAISTSNNISDAYFAKFLMTSRERLNLELYINAIKSLDYNYYLLMNQLDTINKLVESSSFKLNNKSKKA